jgi:UDP-arabinose 4-epimerase
METVLVTGGAGFIGSHTCKALAKCGFLPVAFDNLSQGHAEFVRWGPFAQGDILNAADLDRAFAGHRPDAVIHFAALAYVGESVTRPLAYYRVNVAGLVNVAEAMLRHGTRTIVFSSSCATYGIPDSLPIVETALQGPINPYGRSKLTCEQILIDTCAAKDLRFAILRYFNAAGADPDRELAELHHPETHLIPLAIDAAIGRGPPLQILGADYPTLDGTCERDFIHVSDLASAHVQALLYLNAGNRSLTVNLGTGRAASVRKVIAAVEQVTRQRVPVTVAARRLGDPPVLVADPARARSLLGFNPLYPELETIVATAWQARVQHPSSGTG